MEVDDEEQRVDLAEWEQERVVDLVRLQPTKNTELQDQWGLDSGSEVHQYLESTFKDYYFRDDEGYIRATDAAEEFAREHQDVYQDVTQPDYEPEENPDLQRRDLVMNLLSLRQELGHLPSPEEVNTLGEYRHQRYKEEFGDLFNAFQAAGILPDEVTRTDFYAEDQLESDAGTEMKSEQGSDPEQERETSEPVEPEDETTKTDTVEFNIEEIDVNRPNFLDPEDVDEDDLVGEIQRFAEVMGEPPTKDLMTAYGRFPADAYRETFDSWGDALTSAGCDPEDLPDMDRRKFTSVEVLDVIRAVADELGRPPTTIETGERAPFSHGLGSVRFGSWATALELAGLDPSERPAVDSEGDEEFSKDSSESKQTEPSRQKLLEEIKRLDKSLDRIPYESDMDQDGKFTAYTYRDRFGNWDDALEAAGIDKEAVLLRDMQGVADKVDSGLTQQAMNEHGKYSAGTAARFFGSWSDAKERLEEWKASGDAETNTETDSGEPAEGTEKESPSREALLKELERIDTSLDRIPYPSDMNEDGTFTAHDYQKVFESWDDALAAIGIDKENELLEDLQRVTDKLGKKPTQQEMSEQGTYGFGIYANFFGSWGAAKERLDERDESFQYDQDSDKTVQQEEKEEESDTEGQKGDEDDPIGSIIDETLEKMVQSDDDVL